MFFNSSSEQKEGVSWDCGVFLTGSDSDGAQSESNDEKESTGIPIVSSIGGKIHDAATRMGSSDDDYDEQSAG